MTDIIKGPFKNGMRVIHPGEILVEEWMKPLELDILGFSMKTGIKIKTLKPITKCKAPITPEVANQLANNLRTTPDLWLNLQATYDSKQVKKG